MEVGQLLELSFEPPGKQDLTTDIFPIFRELLQECEEGSHGLLVILSPDDFLDMVFLLEIDGSNLIDFPLDVIFDLPGWDFIPERKGSSKRED